MMSLAAAPYAQVRGLSGLPLDEDGFLIDRKLWNRNLAQRLAMQVGIEALETTHWLIIDFLREHFDRCGALPPMRSLCHRIGVDRTAVRRSFGSCRYAWQIAGLPHPGAEALTYM
jgi:tRNA 2-thiouridine synthesizing protein E